MNATQQADFDAFGWNAIRGLPLSETYGLDYESAREATPRYYGVSFGDGNDGVSHTFPLYVVRTNDPYRLAEIAAISTFKEEYRKEVKSDLEVDGEADWTITAMLMSEPGIAPTYTNNYECSNEDCDNAEWLVEDATSETQTDECRHCHESYSPASSEENDNEGNFAYFLCEVFPMDIEEVESQRQVYKSLEDAFDIAELSLA